MGVFYCFQQPTERFLIAVFAFKFFCQLCGSVFIQQMNNENSVLFTECHVYACFGFFPVFS